MTPIDRTFLAPCRQSKTFLRGHCVVSVSGLTRPLDVFAGHAHEMNAHACEISEREHDNSATVPEHPEISEKSVKRTLLDDPFLSTLFFFYYYYLFPTIVIVARGRSRTKERIMYTYVRADTARGPCKIVLKTASVYAACRN